MLSIPNYYRRKINQNSKKSNHTSQNGHSKKSTDNKCSRQLERDVTPASPTWHSPWDGHWQQTLKGEYLHARGGGEGGLSKDLILGSDMPTPGHISQENHHLKRPTHPTFTSAVLTGARKQPSKCPLTDKNLNKKWYMYTMDYYLALKSHHWNYEIMPKVTTRMNLGGSYTKWSYWDRGIQKNMISLQAKFLKHMKENHLKLKKTFPGNSNTN